MADGSTLEELFESCAGALLSVIVENPENIQSVETVHFILERPNIDLLLFDFLQEMLFQKDTKGLLLRPGALSVVRRGDAWKLECTMSGDYYDPSIYQARTDVKGVTMHNFRVCENADGWKAMFVLDI